MVTSKFVVKLPKEPIEVQLIGSYDGVAACIQTSWSEVYQRQDWNLKNPCS
jgi:hypothetical protein